MRILGPLVAVLVVCGAAAPAIGKRPAPDPTRDVLGALDQAAHCVDDKSPLRVWCIAANGWSSGTPAALPVGKVLVGITLARKVAATGAWDLLSDPTIKVAALAVTKVGKVVKVKLTDVEPTSDAEHLMAAQALAAVTITFKGGKPAVLPKDLKQYLKTLGKRGEHPVAKGAEGWTWTGPGTAELRKVGKFWVVIETTSQGDDGRFITILTERWR